VRVVACASPDYLAARGLPLTPADLVRHDCITIDETDVPRNWAFMEGGQESPPIVKTDSQHIGSRGRGRNHRPGVTRVRQNGEARPSAALVPVLEDFEKDPLPVHILYANESLCRLLRCFLTG
jgi:DNA-binding transcriptional LysR family regulator